MMRKQGAWRLPMSMAVMASSGLGTAVLLASESPSWAVGVAALVFLLCFGWGIYEQVRFIHKLLSNTEEE